jgi:hypothetical protein
MDGTHLDVGAVVIALDTADTVDAVDTVAAVLDGSLSF